jgi:hypothetical protein
MLRVVLLGALLAGCGGTAVTQKPVPVGPVNTIVLTWTIPMTRTDGSPLTTLAGFQIYYGTASGQYATVVVIADPAVSAFELDNLASGEYFFAATAYDAGGLQSSFSNEGTKVIP